MRSTAAPPVNGNACVIAGSEKRNRRDPQLAAVQRDGRKPVFAPVGFADLRPEFLRPARPLLQLDWMSCLAV
jgi:hypothetical protein